MRGFPQAYASSLFVALPTHALGRMLHACFSNTCSLHPMHGCTVLACSMQFCGCASWSCMARSNTAHYGGAGVNCGAGPPRCCCCTAAARASGLAAVGRYGSRSNSWHLRQPRGGQVRDRKQDRHGALGRALLLCTPVVARGTRLCCMYVRGLTRLQVLSRLCHCSKELSESGFLSLSLACSFFSCCSCGSDSLFLGRTVNCLFLCTAAAAVLLYFIWFC